MFHFCRKHLRTVRIGNGQAPCPTPAAAAVPTGLDAMFASLQGMTVRQ